MRTALLPLGAALLAVLCGCGPPPAIVDAREDLVDKTPRTAVTLHSIAFDRPRGELEDIHGATPLPEDVLPTDIREVPAVVGATRNEDGSWEVVAIVIGQGSDDGPYGETRLVASCLTFELEPEHASWRQLECGELTHTTPEGYTIHYAAPGDIDTGSVDPLSTRFVDISIMRPAPTADAFDASLWRK